MKNTTFPAWIRKLGVKKFVLLSIFALVALAYIVTPLIALACGGNNNNNGNGNSNSNSNSNGQVVKKQPKKPAKGNSTLVDTGILLVNKHSVQKTTIAFLQVVGPDHKTLTLSQYNQLVRYVQTPGKANALVRVEMVLSNQPILNGVFTQGQFTTKKVGNKPIGEIVVTTDNKQKLVASPTTPIPLRVPGSTAKQQLNGVRRTQ